jgi:signal peptidase I
MEKSLFTINGQSLYPVYKNGDQVEIHPIEEVRKYDFVVFEFLDRLICKMVVGVPGDTFEIIDDNLVINKIELWPMLGRSTLHHFSNSFNKVLIEDEYIVLGNNNSVDSANFGPVNRKLIVGKLNA